MVLMVCATAYCAPWPMAIISTTEPTPMTMPSMVSAVRSRLLPMACQASPSMTLSMAVPLWGEKGEGSRGKGGPWLRYRCRVLRSPFFPQSFPL